MKHEKNNKKNNNKIGQRPKPPINPGSLIWLFLIFLAVYYFLNVFRGPKPINISYTEFKQEVTEGNVEEITVKGEKIRGTFFEKRRKVADKAKQDTVSSKHFVTIRPSFEDTELMKLLEKNNVKINAESTDENAWLQTALLLLLPWILIIGYFIYVRRKMQGQMQGMMGGMFNVGKSKAKRFRKSSGDVTYDDVAGLENAKRDLREIVEYLKEPEKFAALGANIPKGVLLMGAPGTGKTLLARATAGEANVTFYSISGSEFIEMFVGVGASRVRDMFENAKKEAPAIIFIDEIDSIGRARGTGLGGGHDEREQTLNQILSEMDGFAPHESVIVMAATNRPDVLDPALTRPGRFDRQITLERPQKKARQKILQIHMREVPLADDIDVEKLASRTVGFSGADLQNLVNEAALLAGRKQKKKVDMEDFDEARDKILLGHEREDMINEDEREAIAYHEAGHALMAKLLPGADPLKKVTIIPRGRSLGATEQMPEEDRYNLNRSYLLNRIAIALGGRSAEKVVFGEMTTGAENDLKQVTHLARRMVCNWGMSEKLGPVSFRQGEEHLFLGREMTQAKDFSEHTARIIDEEIQKIIQDMENKTVKMLKENRDNLDALANALLEHETLEDEQIERLLDLDSKAKEADHEKSKRDVPAEN
ncbi:ATP-dependent zinc metalloprotease FtsH [candidate division KSB1 bacterium]|nr:ATP-dependent zinc metalloprotease FtsH [candidate division KSB1 bacterium]NIR68499.1 ATP-dependent zinc metalloprotease FtsH [candidate division KSB1 bacterium]NIS22513.1 ATP-dependent zinc metalloprotease FtsH [candidate division KSB1 bacterium]NIT69357.1 ATP-dependent zinc metalloprotease FtsH [candidate division KSB1 bacterium]NIU23018.1 ATP-dependent zinc metalloprotease FtsH [candidate division KSB1 bacterium]